MRWQKIVWSNVEVEWLKKNKKKPINQLTIELNKSRNAINKKIAELEGKTTGKGTLPPGKKTKIGKRKDCDNLFLRSGWEADIYRWLKTQDDVDYFQYEPTDFTFYQFGIKKGTISYTPDFKVTYKDGSIKWVEVKGYLKPQDKTKLRRFQKFYPEEAKHLVAVTGSKNTKATEFFKLINVPIYKYFNELNKECRKTIPGWES